MVSLETIYSWFKTKKKPTESQFRQTWDSFWHKSEQIPVNSIVGIDELLSDQADADLLNAHMDDDDRHITKALKDEIAAKADYEDLPQVAKTGSYYDLTDYPVFQNDGNAVKIVRSRTNEIDATDDDSSEGEGAVTTTTNEPTPLEIPNPIIGDTAEISYANKIIEHWAFTSFGWELKFAVDYAKKENLSDFTNDGDGTSPYARVSDLVNTIDGLTFQNHVDSTDVHVTPQLLQNIDNEAQQKVDTALEGVKKYETATFKVGGDFDKLYPVVFLAKNSTSMDLHIYRNNVHENEMWRGALSLRVTDSVFSNYGHFGDAFKFTHYWNGANKLAKWIAVNRRSRQLVVYLHGDTTYNYEIKGVSDYNVNEEGKDVELYHDQYAKVIDVLATIPEVSEDVSYYETPGNGVAFTRDIAVRNLFVKNECTVDKSITTPLLKTENVELNALNEIDTYKENLLSFNETTKRLEVVKWSDWKQLSLVTGATADAAQYRIKGDLVQIYLECTGNANVNIAAQLPAPSKNIKKVIPTHQGDSFGTATISKGATLGTNSATLSIYPFNRKYCGTIEYHI